MLETARDALYPVLPLRDIVVFPHMIVPLFVGREKSVRALEDVMKDDKQILLVTQKNAAQDDPSTSDIYTIGTIGTVLQLLKLPDGTVKVLVEGGQRARIVRFADNDQFFQANAEVVGEKPGAHQEIEALARTVVTQFEQYIKLNKKIPPEVLVSINQIEDPGKLADTVASHLTLKIPEQQEPDVGRGDGRPQLPRLDAVAALAQADQDQARHPGRRAGAERRPFWAGEGQGANSRIPGRPAAHEEDERPDPVSGRPARRRQDLAR